MAKNKKANIKDTSIDSPLPSRKKKKKWPVIILLILIAAGIGYFFRKPIWDKIKDIPIIEKYIPSGEEEEKLSTEELEQKIQIQEEEMAELKAEIERLNLANTTLTDKNDSLKQYEEMYTEFMQQKESWDTEVAKTNPALFMQQFESTYPDVAERIYQTLKGEKIISDKQAALSKTIASMEEEQAAKALELLISTDAELVQTIFSGMSVDQRGLVLSSMTSEGAAQVIKLISPDEEIMD